MLEPDVRQAFCVVVGIGQDSHLAADNAAALLVWRMKTARLRGARQWAYANDEASRIWRLANLGRYGGNRFSRAPLLIAIVDGATARARGQAVMLVRSFHGDGDKVADWLATSDCRRGALGPREERLAACDQIVLAVSPDALLAEASRGQVVEHARAIAGALARQPAPRAPRVFLLLIDKDQRFLSSLGPGAATPALCAANGGSAAWEPIAESYVLENYRLAELLDAGGLRRGGMTPLYGSVPAGDESSLLGIGAWSEHLLSLLEAGAAGYGNHVAAR
jgi:hypothetical protein